MHDCDLVTKTFACDDQRFETCAHRWVHVGEAGYGVAVANDSTYGHDIGRATDAAGPRGPLIRGLIYEDAPESIRSPAGKSIIVDNRLANLEMALRVTNDKISALETKIAAMGK